MRIIGGMMSAAGRTAPTPATETPSGETLIGSTGVCCIVIFGGGVEPVDGAIFASRGAGVPLAGVFVVGTAGAGIPGAGVRRGTTPTPLMPPMSVAFGAGVPAAGVLRRGTIGGGLCEPVPMSVVFDPPTPRTTAGGRALSTALSTAFSIRGGGGRELPTRGTGGRVLPTCGGGGRELPLAGRVLTPVAVVVLDIPSALARTMGSGWMTASVTAPAAALAFASTRAR
jgi:hypothetical protein